MSYFSNHSDPDDYDDLISDNVPRKRSKRTIGIGLLIVGLIGTTTAANISISGGRKEFGQGIYQIKACDQWVGIGLESGAGIQNAYIAKMKLYGFDPGLCLGRIFRIKVYNYASSQMNLFMGAGTTTAANDSVTANVVTLLDTSTAQVNSGYSTYQKWAVKAVTLIDPQGRQIPYVDNYQMIDYTSSTGVYTIYFTYPLALVVDAASVTIESAKP